MRSAGGANSAPSGVVARATKSRIADFTVPSFQEASGWRSTMKKLWFVGVRWDRNAFECQIMLTGSTHRREATRARASGGHLRHWARTGAGDGASSRRGRTAKSDDGDRHRARTRRDDGSARDGRQRPPAQVLSEGLSARRDAPPAHLYVAAVRPH